MVIYLPSLYIGVIGLKWAMHDFKDNKGELKFSSLSLSLSEDGMGW